MEALIVDVEVHTLPLGTLHQELPIQPLLPPFGEDIIDSDAIEEDNTPKDAVEAVAMHRKGEGERGHLMLEALPIFAQEDPHMIGLLGRQKYIDIVTTAAVGWIEGVLGGPHGKSRIHKSTMQQNRHTCVALYLEEEYKALALEAHFDCKRPDIPVGIRPSFQCKFCKQCFKDKNTLSYHRMMTQCPEYKGKDLLKMYPTWTKSDANELTRLGEKYGKTLPNRFK
ncbi:hypothetical protein CY35_07G030500 [Sphagnum magellanicum]|uniref:Uncharacterized protein n=1 Tax=Sphagnum magellanicum TaxID=128215 RepID=A0ACB8HJS4_9BRYO|nr:hypothetical protein CY35_07G030500 [Sphagnum magellanicum]